MASDQRGTNDLGRLIRLVHQTGLAPQLWPNVIAQIRRHFGSDSALLAVREHGTNQHILFSDDGLTEDWWRAYNGYFQAIDTYARGAEGLAPGAVVGEQTLVRRAGMSDGHRQSEFYADFLKPFRMDRILTGITVSAGDCVGSLRLYRGGDSESFTMADRDQMKVLTAHIAQACRVAVLLAPMLDGDTAADLALEACPRGIMFVDARGVVTYRNPAAAAMVSRGDGLTMRDGRLGALEPKADHRLETSLFGAVMTATGLNSVPGGLTAVPRPAGLPAYQVRMAPVVRHGDGWEPLGQFDDEPVSAIVIITDPSGPHRAPDDVVHALRLLSPAGANLTARLSDLARALPAVAERPQGAAEAVTWDRLRDLFAGGDVKVQSSLVRLIDEANDPAGTPRPPESPARPARTAPRPPLGSRPKLVR